MFIFIVSYSYISIQLQLQLQLYVYISSCRRGFAVIKYFWYKGIIGLIILSGVVAGTLNHPQFFKDCG